MKTSTILLAGVSIFAGVFGALRLENYLEHRSDTGAGTVAFREPSLSAMPADYPTASTPAFDFRAASKKVMPSVVSIDKYERVSRGFFDTRGVEAETSTGSGVIVSQDGVIVTNNHVVQGATKVKVRFSDGRTKDAKVLGRDSRSDLAVIKVDAPNLTPIEMGMTKDIEVGEWVLAVGNPLGFSNTVSVGVISSLKRNVPVGQQGLVDALQTDAAINPGNSGGALTDAQGRLIGINAAIASGTGQSVGIGFAIPVDRVKTVVSDIVKYGYARWAGLGITTDPRMEGILGDPDARYRIGQILGLSDQSLPSRGLLIHTDEENVPPLLPNGPVAKAGLKEWDIITEINGTPVNSMFDLNQVVLPLKPGDKVQVKYWSRGQVKTVPIVLEALVPDQTPV